MNEEILLEIQRREPTHMRKTLGSVTKKIFQIQIGSISFEINKIVNELTTVNQVITAIKKALEGEKS